MSKKCSICSQNIKEEFGKLKGTLLKVIENIMNQFIYVCYDCQDKDGWMEKAKIRAANSD